MMRTSVVIPAYNAAENNPRYFGFRTRANGTAPMKYW